jgi:hypothetical protein
MNARSNHAFLMDENASCVHRQRNNVGHWQPYGEANTMANNPNDRGMQNPNQAQQGQGKQASSQAPHDKQKTQNLGSQDQKKQGQNLGSQDRGTSGGMSGSSRDDDRSGGSNR